MENTDLKEMCLEKFGFYFIARDFLSIMKIGEEGHETIICTCISFLPRLTRESSYINQANLKRGCFRWF